MPRYGHPPLQRPVRTLALLGFAALSATAVGACGSSSHSSDAALVGTVREQQCTNIADVLSDGPDPNADPVGYAEAQVLPLEQLKISDPTLRRAVRQLAHAYGVFSSTDGKAVSAAVKVSAAEGEIDRLCPNGVGSQLLPGQAVP